MQDVNGKVLHIGDMIVTQAYGIMKITDALDEDNPEGHGALVYVSDTTGYGRGNLRLKAAGAVKLPDMKDLARQALDCQDACNLSGVVHTFSQVITELRTLLRAQAKEGIIEKFGTDLLNEHPVCVLFASKIVSLTHYEDEGSHVGSFSHAYDWAKKGYLVKISSKDLRKALDAQFDAYPGRRINMPALSAMMIQSLLIVPSGFDKASKIVTAYIKRKGASGYLIITIGKDGGVCRASDLTEKELQVVKERASATVKGFAIKKSIIEGLEKSLEIVRAKPAKEFV